MVKMFAEIWKLMEPCSPLLSQTDCLLQIYPSHIYMLSIISNHNSGIDQMEVKPIAVPG